MPGARRRPASGRHPPKLNPPRPSRVHPRGNPMPAAKASKIATVRAIFRGYHPAISRDTIELSNSNTGDPSMSRLH